MGHLFLWRTIRRRRYYQDGADEAGVEEDTLRRESLEWKQALMALTALVAISQFAAATQKPATPAQSATSTAQIASGQLPKIWHSEASHKDFRVEIKGDVFHADWINLPAPAAKDGASMQIECRRTGAKWVGSATVYQGFADSSATAGKDTKKMCHLTARFEVDSITPEKITFHSEALRGFDYSKCQILKTAWEEFTWIPKK